jgi:hypothetical protein
MYRSLLHAALVGGLLLFTALGARAPDARTPAATPGTLDVSGTTVGAPTAALPLFGSTPGACVLAPDPEPYAQSLFTVTPDGSYAVDVVEPISTIPNTDDTILLVYEGTFDPTDACAHFVGIGNATAGSGLPVTLAAASGYVLVVAGFFGTEDAFTVRITGPDGSTISPGGPNGPPVADAGPDQTVVAWQAVTLDGSGSSDPDGDPLTYTWREGAVVLAGPSADTTAVVTLGVGTHAIELTVADPAGAADTDTVEVTVEAAPSAPVAVADTLATDEDVALDVPAPGVLGNDTDANGDTLTAALVDGPAHAASFTLNADGSFAYTPAPDYYGVDGFTYTANDSTASSAVAAVTITVHAVNDAPVADAGDDQTAPADSTGYAAVTLDGTGSTDVDGDSLTYSWKEDGTEIATGATPNVSLAVGVHEVVLAVTDPSGAADADTVAVTVEAPPPPLTVTITPTDPEPPVVVARGERVYLDLTFEVGPAGPSSFQFWTEAVFPNGSVRGPLIGPNTVMVTPPATVTLSLSQRVPNGAPFGAYTYRLKAGTHPGVVLDEDAFSGTVIASEALIAREERGDDAWLAYDEADRLMEPGMTHDLRTATARAETPAETPAEASVEPPASASLVADGLPSAYTLHAAAPNPFATATALRYDLPEGGRVLLVVYDVLGREVAVLVDGPVEPGRHRAVLDGLGLPSGVYLVRLTAGSFAQTQRLTLVR